MSPHPSEADREQYAMGTLPEERVEWLEEHLLECEGCRQQQEKWDAWVRAVRRVGAKLRDEREAKAAQRLRQWIQPVRPVWIAAMAAGLLLVAVNLRKPGQSEAPVRVLLETSRGPTLRPAAAPPGRPITLEFATLDLPGGPYRITLVDATGARVWSGTGSPQHGRVRVDTGPRLKPGQYFVRVQAGNGELLREFRLAIQ